MGLRIYVPALILVLVVGPMLALAAGPGPAEAAEQMRSALVGAQIAAPNDSPVAQRELAAARDSYRGDLAEQIAEADPSADQRIRAGLEAARRAIESSNIPGLAAARGQVWTGLLAGGVAVVERALVDGDAATARSWLALREFRRATRFSRPGVDATLAVERAMSDPQSATEALAVVRIDLLDTYQARFDEALHVLASPDTVDLPARRAEAAALAEGYMGILAPAYAAQRGPAALTALQGDLIALCEASLARQPLDPMLERVNEQLHGFRAAPLNVEEQMRRAGQLRRFLSLIPVEYGRGVGGGQVLRDFEIREAITFRDGAAAAFADLQPALEARDPAATAQVAGLLATLEGQLADAAAQRAVADPQEVSAATAQIEQLLTTAMPPEWQQQDRAADFDVISALLDELESSVASGQYDLAEAARLEAYAVLETGPEARLTAFAPQYIPAIEGLFWYGQDEPGGLARLIQERAPARAIRASRAALDVELARAQQALVSNGTPVAVATNAAIIVFREGLEAVLILASLMGSLQGANRTFRRPLWWGAGLAFGATVITWLLARGVLVALARYGERLEAIVSLIAIGVLLLITNWFFHKVYWTGWIASFHTRKRRIIGGAVGQWLGLITLGFTSIYREGFETVLFLQALVLEAGPAAVLGGVALGLAGTVGVGVLLFALQMKLPYKKMLIVTGVMIGAVLLVMVGNTAHVLQVVGWLPIHPIRAISLPYWAGMWFGLYATWEGVLLQAAAGGFVIGSYVLAERLRHHAEAAPPPTAAHEAEPAAPKRRAHA